MVCHDVDLVGSPDFKKTLEHSYISRTKLYMSVLISVQLVIYKDR